MNEAAIAARRAYMRAWKKKNPDKVRAMQERYWMKKARKATAGRAELDPAGCEKKEA